jgi:hypothetical protein
MGFKGVGTGRGVRGFGCKRNGFYVGVGEGDAVERGRGRRCGEMGGEGAGIWRKGGRVCGRKGRRYRWRGKGAAGEEGGVQEEEEGAKGGGRVGLFPPLPSLYLIEVTTVRISFRQDLPIRGVLLAEFSHTLFFLVENF